MINKRVSFEKKIEELLEIWATVEFSKIENTNKYIAKIEFKDCKDTNIGNDLWRTLTNLYNNYK